MKRLDLYTCIHKGIRRSLFETAREVAAADFEDEEACAAAREGVRGMLAFLDEHAQHEDEVILPVLSEIAPELFADLRAEHARLDGLQREVEGIVARLERASAPERISLGLRLADRMGKLVAAHLVHLAREENEANRVLWAHRDDGQLLELQGRIVANIAPDRLGDWYALALPAMNVRERREMLGGMRAGMPVEVFEQVTASARAELGEPDWQAALA